MPDRKINVNRIAAKAQEIKNPRKKTAAAGKEIVSVVQLDSHPDVVPDPEDPRMEGGRPFDGSDWDIGWAVMFLRNGIFEITVKGGQTPLPIGKYLFYIIDQDSGFYKKIG